ncbi:hypothetical protein LF817_13605 [Halobacillus sp. A1]|uniref:hypothetical protein n=1 Tax=Halobacillus sp. A1 TaxID=2880262 RepID=UPI0020A6896E|nr:hypothetical protein [Halobacillus sp. A1]MCP3032376.1 hypothetical protein [Halobacillus sp. A1]
MLFTEQFKLQQNPEDDWFDPILDVDTEVFIDPFLLFEYENENFNDAHKKIVNFFSDAFKLAATSSRKSESLVEKKLERILTFPEVDEICLGYSGNSTGGSGTGEGFSENIASSIHKAIDVGMKEFNHFEEIAILESGIGPDRISDMCANIIKEELIQYTQKICKKYSVPVKSLRVRTFNERFLQWRLNDYDLPLNPYNEKPILLVPSSILRDLPSIGPDSFKDWAWTNENEILRNDFNFEIKSQINKQDIIELATQRTDLVDRFIEYVERQGSNAYDLELDKKLVYRWYEFSKGIAQKESVQLPTPEDEEGLKSFVSKLIEAFNNYIVNNGGYKLLWNEKPRVPRKEEASQLLLYGMVKEHCRLNNVDLTRESDAGRGPVDFKFSNGYKPRVLIEVKRANSSKLEHGLESQLPQYLASEDVKVGYYVVIVQKDEELSKARNLKDEAVSLTEKLGKEIQVFIIDATDQKPSASKI